MTALRAASLKVRPRVADRVALAACGFDCALAIKRADLEVELVRRVEGVRADPQSAIGT